MPDDLAKQLLARSENMVEKRANWDGHWQEVRDFILPLVEGFTSTNSEGHQDRSQILDNSAEGISEQLVTAIHGLVANPATKWFDLRVADSAINDRQEVRFWLEDTRKRLTEVFEAPESKWTNALSLALQEIVDFGTGGIMTKDRPGRLPIFQARPLSELFLAENEDGVIDTVHRKVRMAARQAVKEFADKAGKKVIAAASDAKTADREFTWWHCIYPREERFAGTPQLNMPIASVWVNQDDKTITRISGFQEMPISIGRWRKARTMEVYGRGPGSKALADVKSLQRVMKDTFRAYEKAIDPTLLVADDGVLGPISTRANAIIYTRAEMLGSRRPAVEALDTGARPDIGEVFAQEIRQRIEIAYFAHFVRISRDSRMTATQVVEIVEETMRIMGPFLGRIQTEQLSGVIERLFGILLRAGALLPPPAVLSERRIEVVYVSPSAKAQQLAEVRGISNLYQIGAPIIETKPDVTDNIDADKAFVHMADKLGVPADMIRPAVEVRKLRQARAAEIEREQQKQDLERLAASAQSAGQAAAAFSGAGNA